MGTIIDIHKYFNFDVSTNDLLGIKERKDNMKLIDLLNQMAEGEETPNKIKFDGAIFEKDLDTNEENEITYCINIGVKEHLLEILKGDE